MKNKNKKTMFPAIALSNQKNDTITSESNSFHLGHVSLYLLQQQTN